MANKAKNWLDKLNFELSEISSSDVEELISKLEEAFDEKNFPKEQVAGICTPYLQKIWYLFHKKKGLLTKKTQEMLLQPTPPEKKKEQDDELYILENDILAIQEILITSCYHSFPVLLGKKNIGLNGSKVVWFEDFNDTEQHTEQDVDFGIRTLFFDLLDVLKIKITLK